jgi:hypothetical protein
MISVILGIIIIVILAYIAYTRLPPPGVRQPPVAAYDNQFELFRDMEPETQTRENPWIGFLQEDTANLGTGPIGEFMGADSSSGSAWLYTINEPSVNESIAECNTFDSEFEKSKDPWSVMEAQRLQNLKNACRQAEERVALGTLARTYAYCNGCSCRDDTNIREASLSPGVVEPNYKETAFRTLSARDNLSVCSRIVDGVKYACDPTCCNPTCR